MATTSENDQGPRQPLELQEPYDARPIRFLELWREAGWTLKVYGIAYQHDRPRAELVEAAKTIARERVLPEAVEDDHYGVGFLIAHDGRGVNFVCVDYWADENELHHHTHVSPAGNPDSLEDVTPTGLTACVWELRVLCFERQAWIDAVLANPQGPDVERYLARRLNEDA